MRDLPGEFQATELQALFNQPLGGLVLVARPFCCVVVPAALLPGASVPELSPGCVHLSCCKFAPSFLYRSRPSSELLVATFPPPGRTAFAGAGWRAEYRCNSPGR